MMSDRSETKTETEQAPPRLDAEWLAAWSVPEPAPDLAERVLDHVDTVMTMMPDANATTPIPHGSSVALPDRRGLGLAVTLVAMVAAAALVLALGPWWRGWRGSSGVESPAAAVVVGPTPAPDPSSEPPGADGAPLVVRTIPRDAQVWIDGKPVAGPSPFAVSRLVRGTHRLTVERDGYLPVERMIEGGSAMEIPIELSIREVVLVLSVDPPEAMVTLRALGAQQEDERVEIGSDGDRHVLRREPGVRYEVEARAPGYVTRRVPLPVGGQADVPVTLSLAPDPEDPRARARRSRRSSSHRSPDLKDPFGKRPGKRASSIDDLFEGSDGSADSSSTGSSSTGSDILDLVDPYASGSRSSKKAKSATLRVGVGGGRGPARIHVDGKYVGITPLLSVELPAGRHEVTASWPDGTQERRAVNLTAGGRGTLKFE
ncbi:MAG: PEGA domain-containing protein [Myxococcota bacterium]